MISTPADTPAPSVLLPAAPYPVPSSEAARLAALARYGLSGLPPEERFNRIARLAARIIGTPVALVAVMDEARQDFIGVHGTDLTGTDRRVALCNYTLLEDGPNVVADLRDDPRYADNPLVTGPLGVRAYAGIALRSPEGLAVGTLCAIDFVPHAFSNDDHTALADLGVIAAEEIERTLKAQREVEHRAAVSGRADAEEALREANRTLEARVHARTEELNAANRELEARNRELQEFAYVASHDLQEPLRKIQSFAGLLASDHAGALGDEGRFFLQRIDDAAGRMSRLVHDLLALSRVSTRGRAFVAVDLDQTLDTVMSDLELRLADTRGRVEVEGVLPAIQADPLQMHQLLLNLVGNALKFVRPGVPPFVEVRVEDFGARVQLTVQDNGVGFDPKYADRIFAPFQRLHGRAAYEGTGMGLAIVRRIVERHGGTVEATSTPGEGSRFVVTLPKGGA